MEGLGLGVVLHPVVTRHPRVTLPEPPDGLLYLFRLGPFPLALGHVLFQFRQVRHQPLLMRLPDRAVLFLPLAVGRGHQIVQASHPDLFQILLARHASVHHHRLALSQPSPPLERGEHLLQRCRVVPGPGLHLGDERFQFGIRAGGGEQVLLAGEGVLQLAGQFEPLLLGTRREVAEGADDLLAGAFGSEVAFDEEVVEVGLAADRPRSFADIHTRSTIKTLKGERVETNHKCLSILDRDCRQAIVHTSSHYFSVLHTSRLKTKDM